MSRDEFIHQIKNLLAIAEREGAGLKASFDVSGVGKVYIVIRK